MKALQYVLFCCLSTSALMACAQRPENKVKAAAQHPDKKELAKYSVATFAAGCFWHEEAMFESIKGVKEAVSGYAGGTTGNPNYETLETGTTGHAETVNVYYDPAIITYTELVKLYFAGQDPTQVNGQGPDHGTQYRSILFYRNESERKIAEDYKNSIQPKYSAKIAVQLLPFTKFWEAENYHQNYIENNPGNRYVQLVSIPEIKRLQREFPNMVKPGYSY